MSARRNTGGYKRFEYFTDKSDFEAPFQFMCDLPPVPIEPKLLNFSIPLDRLIKYNPTCLEINREQTFLADVMGGINIDLINQKQYAKKLDSSELKRLTEEDLELSKLVLNADSTKIIKSDPHINLARSDSTQDILNKLNYKNDKQKSRYNNLDNEEVSMYLRHTQILTSGASKTYGKNFDDPIKTVEDYHGEEFFESGENLNTDQYSKLIKNIHRSFDKIKDIKVGMQKPGAPEGVYAKSVKPLYPCFEYINKPSYLCQFYDNPLKGIVNDDDKTAQNNEKIDLNNESVLIKDNQEKSYKLFAVQENSRGLLGKRRREEHDGTVYIKRQCSRYKMRGVYRVSETDESIQQSTFLLYNIGNEQLSYLPLNKRLSLIRNKEIEKKKPKFDDPDNDEVEDHANEVDYTSLFVNISEREYTNNEISRKQKNWEKINAPICMDSHLLTKENMHGIKELYEPPPLDFHAEEEREERLDDVSEEQIRGDESNDENHLFGKNYYLLKFLIR